MNLLFVLEYYHPHKGGVETVFKHLCEGLAKKGHNIQVLTSRFDNLPKREVVNGVNIVRISTPVLGRYCFTFSAILSAFHYAKHADYIHTTTFNGAFPAWVAAKLRRKKSIITIHEVWLGKWQEVTKKNKLFSALHTFLERCIYLLNFDAYVSVSDATKNDLKEYVSEKKIHRIHNGVDYSPWTLKEDETLKAELGLLDRFVYLAYGRPGPSKGFEYLIDAIPLIQKQIPNAKAVLILSKNKDTLKKYHQLKQKAEGFGALVLDFPPQKMLPSYVNIADCIVIPSLSEGFGYTSVEASSLGKKIVATNIPTAKEVLSGEVVLVDKKSASAIAKGVLLAYQNKLSTLPRKHFSWDDNIKKHEDLYNTL